MLVGPKGLSDSTSVIGLFAEALEAMALVEDFRLVENRVNQNAANAHDGGG